MATTVYSDSYGFILYSRFSVNNGTTLNKQTVLSSITGNEVNVNANILGVVLNKINIKNDKYSSYYYYYGEEDKK